MAQDQDPLVVVLERARAGEGAAAEWLVKAYWPLMRKVVRRRLPPRLRDLWRESDVVQEVWADFFTKTLKERDFETKEELWLFLFGCVRNEVLELSRHYLDRKKRTLKRQLPLDHPDVPAEELAAREPGPEEQVMNQEQWEKLRQGQPEREQRILELLRDGWTRREIAEALAVSDKTIQRAVEGFRLQFCGFR
jgi:RNA polymerase sigma factor (sigma-70 family)